MNSLAFYFAALAGGVMLLGGFLQAQNTAPVPPPPLVKDKSASPAAAIEPSRIIVPSGGVKPLMPPTVSPGASTQGQPDVRVLRPIPPGTLKPNPPPTDAKPPASRLPPVIGALSNPPTVAPAGSPTTPPPPPLPPPPSAASMTKEQALDSLTQDDKLGIEAPRIPTRSDKISVVTSTSASGQFRVHGSDLSLRSRMSSHLDEIAKELRSALKDADASGIPVNVHLSQGVEAIKSTSGGAPPVGIQITEIEGGGFHLQLDIRDVPALKLGGIRSETVRMLLAERILRGHASATPPKGRLLLPDWIFTGTMQTLDFRAAERPTTMFAAIFKSGKIYGIEEIIEASPTEMDSLSRAIYETSCGALVMALIDQPDGGKRFNKFLNSLAVDPRPERELLNEAFPGFAASVSSLNKWWSLQLASLAKRRVADPLNADETMLALEQAITIRYVAKTEEVPKDIKKRPFETPAPLFGAPTPKPKSPPPALDEFVLTVTEKSGEQKSPSNSASKSKVGDADEGDEDASVSKKEGSPWLRYLTFGLMGSNKGKEDSGDDAKKKVEEDQRPLARADMPRETSKEEEGKQEASGTLGFLGRLMSRNSATAVERRKAQEGEAVVTQGKPDNEDRKKDGEKEKQVPEATPVDPPGSDEKGMSGNEKSTTTESEVKPKAEPKAGAKSETSAEPEEEQPNSRGSLLNPLNWFRSGKEPAEEEKEVKEDDKPTPEGKFKKSRDNEEKTKSAFWTGWALSPISLVRWHVAPLAELWAHLGGGWPSQAFLDFLKRKKSGDGEAEDETKKAAEPEKPRPVPAESKKKAESKKEEKTQPKTTNPNARPAAKPVQPADGSPRTTNPAAKPVPIPQVPLVTTTSGDDDLPKLPPGSEWVEIHLEDYKHILQHPDRVKILEKNVQALRALQPQASVLMRPIVNGYLGIVMDLQDGKNKDLDQRLKDLRSYVTLTAQQTKAVRDYIDYYEANKTEQLSGAFEDFLDLPNIIRRELPTREDPIARYLDAI
ncbi:MAG: hypothetical protein RIS79_42, partial [Verrucomicrobiota bacterium]